MCTTGIMTFNTTAVGMPLHAIFEERIAVHLRLQLADGIPPSLLRGRDTNRVSKGHNRTEGSSIYERGHGLVVMMSERRGPL